MHVNGGSLIGYSLLLSEKNECLYSLRGIIKCQEKNSHLSHEQRLSVISQAIFQLVSNIFQAIVGSNDRKNTASGLFTTPPALQISSDLEGCKWGTLPNEKKDSSY